ncbi:MAG: GldG family protein [Defluviitaleaceae bacterium]|nr:GldG family protein [Defluviitaleaceae bacterium]MCL2275050.1 GldG family protein [Defluviitaleaceae bacterium]
MKLANFKEKRFRYGTFSTAMMLLAVLLFVFVNLLAGEFNRTWDLTEEELFTLTQQSRTFLDNELHQDVTITMVVPTGTEEPMLVALLAEYANAHPRITTQLRDPMVSPAFVQGFASGMEGGVVPNHSIIVQSGTQYRVITPDLLITAQHNQWGQVVGIQSINFERQITTAIHAVTQGEVATVYKVLGSGESPLAPSFVSFLETENFIVRSVDAIEILRDGIPADADILLLSTPQWDWPTEKADRILAFLENEGRAFIAADPMYGTRLPNFDRVLAAYGIRISDYVIMESDPRQHLMLPMFVIPQLFPDEHITLPLAIDGRMMQLLRFPAAIEPTGMQRASTFIEPLMITSVHAFGRVNMELESPLFHEGDDIDGGPFLMAARITDSVFTYRNINTHIVVVGSGDIWDAAPREIVGDNNFAFVASSLRWLTGQGPGLFIPTRTPPGFAPLMLTQFDANIIAGFSMGVLPLVTLAFGVFVWFRRRHS